MQERIFKEREHAMEATYFRQQDTKLLEALRRDAGFDELAIALRDKLAVDNSDLLLRVRALGATAETAGAFLLAPLIQIAWAGGSVNKRAREAILEAALERGIAVGSPAHEQLLQWLNSAPPDILFETSLEVISYGLGVLAPNEREKRVNKILDACREIARASKSTIAKIFGLAGGCSAAEVSALSRIRAALRTARPRRANNTAR